MKTDWGNLEKRACEAKLSVFLRQAIKVLEPETTYIHNWHIDVLCDHLEAVAKYDIQNLDINIPPRTIKTLLVNIVFPCWVWTWWPDAKFLSASHTANLSMQFNMKRRRLVKSDWYQSMWPVELKADSDTKSRFENNTNGFMASFSKGGNVTGEGGDFLISDDLISASEAFSEADREKALIWYFQEYFNRFKDSNVQRRINVNQRLHESDISGVIKKDHPYFERLVIPMLKEKGQLETSVNWVDPREVGDFLQPSRFGPEEYDVYYKSLGAYGWAGQMQQRPVPAGGGIIKQEWIQFAPAPSDFTKDLISIDATFKDSKKSDFVTMEYWTRKGPDFYLVDYIRGKWDFPETLKRAETFWEKHKPQKLLIEDKANGPAIISILKKKIPGIKAISPKDSKEARVQAVAHFWECGNVFINDKLSEEKKEDFVKEVVTFPNATHDDLVDGMSQAIEELRDANSTDLLFA